MLLVSPTGRRTWMIKKAHAGKRIKLKIGEYPELSLAAARELFDDIVAYDGSPADALARGNSRHRKTYGHRSMSPAATWGYSTTPPIATSHRPGKFFQYS